MSEAGFGKWQDMARAPKDGSRILVAVRGTEQGPAEVDVARWGRPDRTAEECWIAADSDPGCLIIYADAELIGWMPLPDPLPRLRAAASTPTAKADLEIEGSGI